jgi:DNA-binding MarR family transcriptional regulator
VSRASGGSKAAIAADVWATLLEVVMGQRNRFFSVLGEFGLTPGDLRALSVLELERSRPMRSLARAWGCDPSNVTGMVGRLEERGLVERRVNLADRRLKSVALTALGARTKADLFARLHQPPDELLTLDRKRSRRCAPRWPACRHHFAPYPPPNSPPLALPPSRPPRAARSRRSEATRGHRHVHAAR